jgi:hypothetical protein
MLGRGKYAIKTIAPSRMLSVPYKGILAIHPEIIDSEGGGLLE